MIVKTSSFVGVMLITVRLIFNKKLKCGYISFLPFILSLLLLSTHSSAFEAPQHKFNFHLDSGFLRPARGAGFGISYDYVDKKGHSFALESHRLASSSFSYVGYRYHNNIGLYAGLGLAWVNRDVNGVCFNTGADTPEFSCVRSFHYSGLGLSLGYTHVFKSGFSVGASALFVPSTLRPADSIDFGISVEPLSIDPQNIGLILGYTLR